MFRKAMLATIFVLGASVIAADKPAVQARQEMEARRGGHSTTTVQEHFAAVTREEHPIINVGYSRTAPAYERDYVHSSRSFNTGTKPAVQARMQMER